MRTRATEELTRGSDKGYSKPNLPWYREITRDQWCVLGGAWCVWAFDAIDFLMITFVLSDIARTFDVSLNATSLLLLAAFGVRWLGGLLFGGLSDRIGRKVPLLIVLAWFTACTALTGLSWSFASIVVFRLLLGFGMAPAFSLGVTMVAETWPEKYRALGIGFLDSGWGIGSIGAAVIYGLVYPHFGWRGMFFVGIAPAILLGLFISYRVPESPLWKQARVRRVSTAGNQNPIAVLFRVYPGRIAFLTVLMLVLCFGSWPFQGLFPTFLGSHDFSTSVITWITMTSAVGQIAGFFFSGIIAQRFGRRNGLTIMIVLGTLGLCILLAVINHFVNAETATFFTGFTLVGSSGIWGTILAENLPSEVRAAGVGFLYNFGVIGGGIAPYVVLSSLRRFEISMPTGIALFTILPTILATVLLRFARETRDVRIA